MADIKWIKITTDIFDDEKIRIIERMPEGDAILIIWLKILTLAGKKNDCGMVYLTETIPYTPEILSDIFNKDSRIISLAMNTFISFGMITIEDDIIKVLNWEKHQNIDGMNKIRENTRKRVAKYRGSKKIEQCNVTVTESNATEKNKSRVELDKNEKDNIPYGVIVNYLNKVCYTSYKITSGKTKTLIKARYKEGFTLDNFRTVIKNKYVEWSNTDMSKFLRPETLFGPKFEGYLNQKEFTGKIDPYNMSNGTNTVKGFGDE